MRGQNESRIRRRTSIAALLATIALLGAPVARAEVVVHLAAPVEFLVEIPCAVSGAGEIVAFAGTLHVRVSETYDGRDAVHASIHVQPQGIVGVGLSTGDRYRATGLTRETFNPNIGALNYTYVNNFRIIGAGPGNDYAVHQVMHVTLGPGRDLVVQTESVRIDCR